MQQGAFGIRLDPVECLSAYTTSFGNQSDVILVSTYDLTTNTTVAEDLPLLFAAEEYRLLGPGVFWACSTTNSFDCRSPEKWKNDPNLVSNWNVYGYKIDYLHVSGEWGVVEASQNVIEDQDADYDGATFPHCSFTTARDVRPPIPGQIYI